MTDAEKLRDYFVGWQCRLRQHAVRNEDGRPSSGMQATLLLIKKGKQYSPVNTGLVKADSAEITAEFQHIVKKTHDPNLRQQGAIKLLSSAYYQHPKEFSDFLTATFSVDSKLARKVLKAGKCRLLFEQHQQQFTLQCDVEDLAEDDAAYQATYWHNRMFNPVLPAKIKVLKFGVDWSGSIAEPEIA